MATRIGVDIGGTFTDLVYYDEQTGETTEGKVPTVPKAPEEGVIEAVRRHVPKAVIEGAELFLHGTTVGLNALLERRGAKVGLLATEGFRDALEIRRGDRAEMYNLFWRQPEPLVPRHRRLGVVERVLADGTELTPLGRESVLAALARLVAEEVDTIAVSYLHSYANPAHELETEKILREAGFTGGISLSHRISGEYREYERTSTTVIDAFVRARMSNYLKRLESRLRDLGFTGLCLITRSGGGSMTFAEAEERPFETIMSGPVAGAQGSGELSRILGLKAVITADVGGTSFDTSLIVDGWPHVLYEGEVGGMPIQSPWVDVRSIGAGGGSLAYIDAGGLMRVGPQSAGADPGPAAYGKGGTQPTLTDAAAYLGMLGGGELASGIRLDFDKAGAALKTVGVEIGRGEEDTAKGILRIAAASMANAMREVSVEQGLDPRGMVLLPFGGAGPLMATLLAEELHMKRIVVPPLAGNFSAWGLLGADMVQSAARTRVMDLTDEGIAVANGVLAELFQDVTRRSGAVHRESVRSARFDLRYKGQEHWLSIEVPVDGTSVAVPAGRIVADFTAEYERTFGAVMKEVVEIVSVRATLRVPLPRREQKVSVPEASPAASAYPTREAHSFRLDRRVHFAQVPRSSIGSRLAGPAIITESTATFYLDAGWEVSAGGHGELVAVETG
jgi:N-methylhydantoinase A